MTILCLILEVSGTTSQRPEHAKPIGHDGVYGGSQTPASWLAHLAASATPLIVVGAAALYFTGVVYREHLFRLFGLPANALGATLQATMAEGYMAILDVFAIPVLLGCVELLVFYLIRRTRVMRVITSPKTRRRLSLIAALGGLFLLFAGGWFMGVMSAAQHYSRLRNATAGDCGSCFVYRSDKGRLVGLPLGQDDKHVVLVWKRGISILPADRIRTVEPVRFGETLPSWAYPPGF